MVNKEPGFEPKFLVQCPFKQKQGKGLRQGTRVNIAIKKIKIKI